MIVFMKIGEFSKVSGLPISTIRYYSKIGLLRPVKKGSHWDYTLECIDQAKSVKLYKEAGFSLDTIARLLQLKKEMHESGISHDAAMARLILSERQCLYDKQSEVKTALEQIAKHIECVKDNVVATTGNSIPLRLFSLIYCPHCNIPLTWEKVALANNAVVSGNGACHCGFKAKISKGILVVDSRSTALIKIVDNDRQTVRQLSAKNTSYLEAANQWILEQLSHYNFQEKVIFENVINVNCLLNLHLQMFGPDAYFILCDTDVNVINYFVSSMRATNPTSNLLFIVDDGVHHPIKRRSLDVVLDCASSEIFQRYGYECIFDTLKQYCHDGTMVAGRFTYMHKRKLPLYKSKFRDCPNVAYRYQLEPFQHSMERNGIHLLAEMLGTQNLDEALYDGCEAGDIMRVYSFMGEWTMS